MCACVDELLDLQSCLVTKQKPTEQLEDAWHFKYRDAVQLIYG